MTSTGFGAFLGKSAASLDPRCSNDMDWPLARMLVETASWRWIYYIQIIMLTGALVLQLIFYKPPDYRQLHGERSRLVELKRVDWVGLFLLVAGLSLFMLGVSWGGSCTHSLCLYNRGVLPRSPADTNRWPTGPLVLGQDRIPHRRRWLALDCIGPMGSVSPLIHLRACPGLGADRLLTRSVFQNPQSHGPRARLARRSGVWLLGLDRRCCWSHVHWSGGGLARTLVLPCPISHVTI